MTRGLIFLGTRMDQEWQDIPIWESFFDNFPIKTFVELGTGNGGLSTYFALQCLQRGIVFHTFDNQKWLDFNRPIQRVLNMQTAFHHLDIFNQVDEVAGIIQSSERPVAVFCDDGDKPREWRTFSPHTLPGDFLIVHDWGTEFLPENIGGIGVERILAEQSDARGPGWKSMWFRRV